MRKVRLPAFLSTGALLLGVGLMGAAPAYAEDAPPSTDTIADIEITHTVEADYRRVYEWDFEKTGTVGEITVDGETATADVDFAVTATPTSYDDRSHSLTGEITITNTAATEITGTVSVGADIDTSSVCRVTDPENDNQFVDVATVPANTTVTYEFRCSQFADTPSHYGSTVVHFTSDDGTENSIVGFEFTQASESSAIVTILDDHADPTGPWIGLGEAQWNADLLPALFNYTMTVEDLVVGECTEVTNTALLAERERITSATVTICPEASIAMTPAPNQQPEPPVSVETAAGGKTLAVNDTESIGR